MRSAGTILVVGLAEARRARFVALLAQAGHECAEVATTDEALAYVAHAAPPLVVIDGDPANGAAVMDACRRMKDTSPDTFILQISQTFAGDFEKATEIDSSIDAYLVDPIDVLEMLALVRSLLRLQKVESDLRDSEDRLLLAQESAGLAILDWVIPTTTFVHSENFLELFDLKPQDGAAPFDPAQLIERIHPDDLGALIEEFSAESQTARNFDKEFRLVLGDGSIRWIASRGRFFFGPTGKPERMLSLSFDVTQRKTAERANAELASIVASSIDAIVSVDAEGGVISWNAGAERLLGVPGPEITGRPLETALDGMSTQERQALGQRLMDGDAHAFETRQKRKDGQAIDLSVTSAPMRAIDGRVIGASLIMRDVSAQRQREDHVRFLMRELTHRSKNLLAVIQAMARQSLSGGITPDDFVKRFTDRLAGLAGSHDLLSSVDWRGASLMELIRSQLNHYLDLFGTRIVLDGADIMIRPEAAQNIGIALHELSTNAAKYGALSVEDGVVTIAWSIDETNRLLHMKWEESGGPRVVAPTRRGFGHVVMDRITGTALGGKSGIRFEPSGVVWQLDVPAAAAVATATS